MAKCDLRHLCADLSQNGYDTQTRAQSPTYSPTFEQLCVVLCSVRDCPARGAREQQQTLSGPRRALAHARRPPMPHARRPAQYCSGFTRSSPAYHMKWPASPANTVRKTPHSRSPPPQRTRPGRQQVHEPAEVPHRLTSQHQVALRRVPSSASSACRAEAEAGGGRWKAGRGKT